MLVYIITHKYHIVFANITFNQGCKQYTDIDSGKSKQTHESPDKTIPYIPFYCIFPPGFEISQLLGEASWILFGPKAVKA